jgi:regulatory protein RepA
VCHREDEVEQCEDRKQRDAMQSVNMTSAATHSEDDLPPPEAYREDATRHEINGRVVCEVRAAGMAEPDSPSDVSIASEQCVLGALLIDRERVWPDVARILSGPEDFSRPDHRIIFAALASRAAAGAPIDHILVSEDLRREGTLEAAGGFAYLSKITRETLSAAGADAHARNVRDKSLRRRLRLLAEDPAVDPQRRIEQLENHIAQLREVAPEISLPRFDPRRARIEPGFLDEMPDNIEIIVHQLLRRTAGVRASAGGTGKSTLSLYEMICIILGAPLYGCEVMRPGPCVLLTAEDERQVAEHRLWRIMDELKLSRPQREQVLDSLYIEDLTGEPCRFVDVGENGSLVQTAAVREFIERYRDIKPSLVSVDPMLFFGPGERFVNDGEGELMRAGRFISVGINAAVRYEHHIGKAQARDRGIDQYAGRGGSAGADNARFVHVLQVHEADDKLTAPKRCTPEDIAKGRVLRLHVAKDSYGVRLAAPIWIMRTGFRFTHVPPDPIEDADPMEGQLKKLYGFIEAEESAGVRHTPNSLDSRLRDLGLSRMELRATLHVARERRHLLEQDLPKEEQRGARKAYLAPGVRP